MNYATGKFDDVLMAQRYSADGEIEGEPETEDEEMTEYENEESDPSLGGDIEFEETYESPKYRQLVKQKKLALKAEFGKAHIGTRKECKTIQVPEPYTERKCNTINYPCIKNYKPSTCSKEVCVNVPKVRMVNKEFCINIPVWVPGWRKRWRDFKKSGGLAQLKMMAKGMIPYTPIVPTTAPAPNALPVEPSTTLPLPTPTGSGKKGKGRNAGLAYINTNQATANVPGSAPETLNAGSSIKTMLGVGLTLALLTGGIYAFTKGNK